MLKDIIGKNVQILTKKNKSGDLFHEMRGELEIIGYKDGKVIHYDKGPNTVTVWAKHATMHLLTGEVFTNKGRSRNTGTHTINTNGDGTLVSGKQYLSGDSLEWWSLDDTGVGSMIYPFYPTKILFGTGKEGDTWDNFTSEEKTFYALSDNGGWTVSTFGSNILDAQNTYSNAYTAGDSVLEKRKSINHIYSSTLITPTISDEDFGIAGAIKHSLYESTGDSSNLEIVSGNFFAKNEYKGVGYPSFIYAKRDSRFHESGTEVGLSYDSHVENKITFSVTMPEQTGVDAGKFYPYNGYMLKVAGLFCDARFILTNTQPTNDGESDDSPQDEWDNWSKMQYGMMFAKRYIAPITKTHDVGITARWTIYL